MSITEENISYIAVFPQHNHQVDDSKSSIFPDEPPLYLIDINLFDNKLLQLVFNVLSSVVLY